jgi:hypothetical protein
MRPKDMVSLGAKDISRWMIGKGVLWVIELTLRAGLQPFALKPPKRDQAEARSLRP